jgi:ribonuclease J
MNKNNDNKLVFLPLAGTGEIGMNMNLFGYGQPGDHKWIMVDIGVTFADDTIPGVDLIYPDPGLVLSLTNYLYVLL